jgi:hypothetical protein
MICAAGILVAFLMLATTLAWLLAWAKGKWWIRGALGVGVIWAGLALWGSVSGVAGWPVDGEPPEVELWGAMVREPSPDGRDAGAIYLWGHPMKRASRAAWWLVTLGREDKGDPRCWRLPYSRSLHERAEAARRVMASGRRVVARPGQGEEDGEEGGREGEGKAERAGRPGPGMSPWRGEVTFYEFPPGLWPRKYARGLARPD